MNSRLRAATVLCGTFALQGCGGPSTAAALDRSTSLGTKIDRVDLASVPVFGHRVSVTYGADGCIVNGELIAVTSNALIVLDEQDLLWQISTGSLVRVELQLYPPRSSSLYTATTAGSVSTLSHGYWLAISLPAWLAIGLPLANAESSASHIHTQATDAPRLAAYARFPHGGAMDWSRQARAAVQCR
jgi:hypothetical protein